MNSSRILGTISSFAEQTASTRPRQFLEQGQTLAWISFGVHFELSANQADLMQNALLYLPLECKRCFSISAGPRYSLVRYSTFSSAEKLAYRLYRNGRLLFTCGDQEEFLERFRSTVSLYVADASRSRLFIHAGAVGWGDRAILIPGRSFSGKTTLVAEFVRAGATYYSDEFAVIDKRGLVYPYARPLQIRENGSRRQAPRPVEELGGVAGRRPLRVALVVVSRYNPEAQWRPRRLSPGQGLLKILDNTVSARRSPALALSTLKQVVSEAMIVRGVRGEASQLIDWVTRYFDSGATQ